MSRRPLLLIAAAASILLATGAHADSAADGNAGVEALKRGAYAEAVRLFTRALKAGDLSANDQEFAYLNRGKAHLGAGNKTLALADVRKALGLRPDDPDAQAELALLTKGPAPAAPPKPVPVRSPWGSFEPLIGRTWMMLSETPKYQPIHYVRYARAPDGASVTFSGMDPAGNTITGTLQPDSAAGVIHEEVSYKAAPSTATIEMDGDRFAEEVQQGNDYTRLIYTPASRTAFQVEVQKYQADNTWKTVGNLKLIEVSDDMVNALGWKPAKPPGFWKSLGQSLGNAVLQGAAAGLASGLQGPQQ